MTKHKHNYIDNTELTKDWQRWKDSAPDIKDRVVSESLAKAIMEIAKHILQSSKFNRYPNELKEDMIQEGYIKVVKNLKNINPDKGSVFSYITQVLFCSNFTQLSKYYREKNNRRKLLEEELERLQVENPTTIGRIAIQTLQDEINLYTHPRQDGEDDEYPPTI